ncbi:MAG: alanine--tRNA ligase [Candidatus Makana argininalis]
MINSSNQIRKKFLDFFKIKNHIIIPGSSLLINNDKSIMFTNSGMNQFKNVFLNSNNFPYKRVVTSQNCIRAGGKHNDLENVGYTSHHHTFFEMLGNFSFNDYFKKEAIFYAWELLTNKNWFNIPKNKLLVTYYYKDYETYKIWLNEIKLPKKKIISIGDNHKGKNISDNFWQMGETGPCGPCSEIFYDRGKKIYGNKPGNKKKTGNRYIEIWNLVFIQFNKNYNGDLIKLDKPYVDTGMGLERIASVMQNVDSNFKIDIFKKLISSISNVLNIKNYNHKSLFVISDHIRSSFFLINDGLTPSNEGKGYVLRRIIRRAIRHGKIIGSKKPFLYKIVSHLISIMEIKSIKMNLNKNQIEDIILSEEQQFEKTINTGLNLLNKEINNLKYNLMDGNTVFKLYDTYGFPIDLIKDICKEKKINIDENIFNLRMNEQKKRSINNSFFIKEVNIFDKLKFKTKFLGYKKINYFGKILTILNKNKIVKKIIKNEKSIIFLNKTTFYSESGGQIGDKGILKSLNGVFIVVNTKKYNNCIGHIGKLICGSFSIGDIVSTNVNKNHRKNICINHSATHLLIQSLHQILGVSIIQKGSFINHNYLRFDFAYNKNINFEQIKMLEKIINEKIISNLIVKTSYLNFKNDINKVSLKVDSNNYKNKVRIVKIGNFSNEICIGTHVKRTGNIGVFIINSISNISYGIKRIEAVSGINALFEIYKKNDLIDKISNLININKNQIYIKIKYIINKLKELKKKSKKIKNKEIDNKIYSFCKTAKKINKINIITKHIKNIKYNEFKIIAKKIKKRLTSVVIFFLIESKFKINILIFITKNIVNYIKTFDIINFIFKKNQIKIIGNKYLIKASGKNIYFLSKNLKNIENIIINIIKKKI